MHAHIDSAVKEYNNYLMVHVIQGQTALSNIRLVWRTSYKTVQVRGYNEVSLMPQSTLYHQFPLS